MGTSIHISHCQYWIVYVTQMKQPTSTCVFVFFSQASGVAVWMAVSVCQSFHNFGPSSNISTTIGWIFMNFGINTHGVQRMNPAEFASSTTMKLTFVTLREMSTINGWAAMKFSTNIRVPFRMNHKNFC